MSRRRSKGLEFKVVRMEHPLEYIAEQIRVLAIVESEAHFIKVGRQMLCTHTMPRSSDSALEQAKSGFHGVRVQGANRVSLPN